MSKIILCSTARLARSVQQVEQHRQARSAQAQQQSTWQAAKVLTLSQWLNGIIENAILLGELEVSRAPVAELNTMQESLLWEQSIAYTLKQHEAADLFDTTGLAAAAMEANRYVTEWNLSVNHEQATEETRQFLLWRQRFQALCKQNNVLESVRYMQWQIASVAEGAGSLPRQIALAGFDRIHPQLKRLSQALQARGVDVGIYALGLDQAQQLQQVAVDDQDAECRAAVAWVQQQWALQPQAKLAIVVPELAQLRAKLAALLDDVFHPQALAPAYAEIPRCYDFSLGLPLLQQPIIRTALDLLRLGWAKIPLLQSDISYLLHNPYWSSHSREADMRARLDARMRRDLPLNFGLMRLKAFLEQATQGEHALAVEALQRDFMALWQAAQQASTRQLPSAWAVTFFNALDATHWRGERSLSSHEYQATQSFKQIGQQLAQLDFLLGKISASEAIQRLTQLCQAQIFQPESKSQPALQVMGMLEAAAEPLDGVWVMGMNDHIWPPVARPNALISAELQRQAGTPNASSEVQAEFALSVQQRLIKSAPQLIFSYSLKDGERQLRPSPMLQGLPLAEQSPALVSTLAEQLAYASQHDWQWLDDALAPAVATGENVAGGTALLKAQAICPAWAFYQYRLGARRLEQPVNGLDVMERGDLVHQVLAKFWLGRDAQYLNEMPIDLLRNTLRQIADAVLASFNQLKNEVFSAAFLGLEAERLVKLVSAWLIEVEMLRPQGFSVTACEQQYKTTIEDINITLVIDRIDTLEDGRLVLMDYKTGRQLDYKNWVEDQITEPQLPIYAAFLLQDAEVAAVCFAKVRHAENAFAGIAASPDLVQGALVFDDKRGRKLFDENQFPDWPSIIQHWKSRITATAQQLKAGDAAVRFGDEKQLEYCEVLPLLRLPERQLQFERHTTEKHSA
jgi:probable DNA repair protein